MGNLFRGLFVPGENFFLDLSTLLNVLGLVSSTLALLYFRDGKPKSSLFKIQFRIQFKA